MAAQKAENTSGREIVITRVFDAPRELVWEAWTQQKHVEKWWGPRGFRDTFQKFEVKVGGAWVFTMHGPDGTDYPNMIFFQEVVKPERLVYFHGEKENDPQGFSVQVNFETQGGKTKVTMRSLFPTAAARDHVVKEYKAIEGGHQTLDRLGEQLGAMAGENVFMLSRTFDAPRELVFKAWTQPEHMQHWWGPKGAKVLHSKMDLRPGGTYHYCMQHPDAGELWGKFIYREITKPERLVFVSGFSDKDGNFTRHPMSPTWPLEMLSVITFVEQEGKTTVTIRWTPLNASGVERKTFEDGKPSMQQGWGGSLDQLAEYLAQKQA
ncbi:MAG: SRPBCC family protein [Bdellovibrionota bacterium]